MVSFFQKQAPATTNDANFAGPPNNGNKNGGEYVAETSSFGNDEGNGGVHIKVTGSGSKDMSTTVASEANGEDQLYFDAFPVVMAEEGGEEENSAEQAPIRKEEEEDKQKDSLCYQKLIKTRCCSYCLSRFPRTCAVTIGVVIPLCLLIIYSLAFGNILCDNEGPPEIKANDEKLASLYFATETKNSMMVFTAILPRVCTLLYLQFLEIPDITLGNSTLDDLDVILKAIVADPHPDRANVTKFLRPYLELATSPPGTRLNAVEANLTLAMIPDQYEYFMTNNPQYNDPPTLPINSTDLWLFMSECGDSGITIMNALLDRTLEEIVDASSPLTFNWIRCFEGAVNGHRSSGADLTAQQRSKAAQTDVFYQAWNEDRLLLLDEYFTYYKDLGFTDFIAHGLAKEKSANDATGGDTCELNSPAAAWFWFTVQTTIGYGNMPPNTTTSRAMVYTIGFFSILAFGGVLATAGYIASFLFDDLARRWRLPVLTKPWVGAIIWGSVYYSWMVLIAGLTISWKHMRLNENFSWRDAYWFAYISTTTIGFGDVILEPEGIIGMDVLVFAVVFLVGFVFFAAFIGKFAEMILSIMLRGRISFLSTLLEKHVTWHETFANDIPVAAKDDREAATQ